MPQYLVGKVPTKGSILPPKQYLLKNTWLELYLPPPQAVTNLAEGVYVIADGIEQGHHEGDRDVDLEKPCDGGEQSGHVAALLVSQQHREVGHEILHDSQYPEAHFFGKLSRLYDTVQNIVKDSYRLPYGIFGQPC